MATEAEHSFASCYMELCRQQRVRPLPMVCVTLPHSLDFNTDRVKMDDWKPILNSLSFDCTLRSISVRSKYQHRKLLDQADSEQKARAVGKAPVVLTRYLLEWLVHSLSQCLRNSSALTSLELEGIPIPSDCLAVLCIGLTGTKSLRHLSLQRCYIGDDGCELLCRAVAGVHSVRSLNLAQCELTPNSGSALASALCRQKLALYHEAWKQSLRYREPKLDSMPGLRRLTLNGNSKLGNEAVAGIIEAIRDSLWFKALDLQQCGLTEDLAADILDLLQHNHTLVIVDVRLNSGLREDTLSEIYKRLESNELHHNKGEYRWLNLPQQKESSTSIISKRVSSAGNLLKQKQNENEQVSKKASAAQVRSRSAIIRQTKRPPAPIIYRKPLVTPTPVNVKRLKAKPPLPDRRSKQPLKPPPEARVPQHETTAKPSLHLDLQAQIQSVAESSQNDNPPIAEESSNITVPPCVDEEEEEEEEEAYCEKDSVEDSKLQKVYEELQEVHEDRERLLEQLRRTELILSEERARREFTEAKFRSAKSDFAELEQVMRERDRDTRGYLLISQKSMEEICLSFTRLLEMFEESPERSSSVEPEDIKRKFALIIRKTKSENLKRGYFVDDGTVLSRLQLTARYGRSEGNIRTTIEPLVVPRLRIESNIGDTADTEHGLPRIHPDCWKRQERRLDSSKSKSESPSDRARALFASILNGGGRFSLSTQTR